MGSAAAALLKEASGLWCDALALLLHTQWPATGAALQSAPPASTPAAVQTWGQVTTPPAPLVLAPLLLCTVRLAVGAPV